jgi:hypothetical protein
VFKTSNAEIHCYSGILYKYQNGWCCFLILFYSTVLPTKEAQLIEQLISCLADWMERDTNPEPVFLNVYGAQESVPIGIDALRHQFRQPM